MPRTNEPSEEIRAFRCPVCQRLIEIDTESKLYIKLEGKIVWGEGHEVIAASSGSSPYRICLGCASNLFHKDALRDIEIPPLREGSKIRPL